jgi:hypothetical protein
MPQILNNSARVISFSITTKFAAPNEPPEFERIIFRPTEIVEVSQKDFDKIKGIPLFKASMDRGDLVVTQSKKKQDIAEAKSLE